MQSNIAVKVRKRRKLRLFLLAETGKILVSGLEMTLIPLSYAVIRPLELMCPFSRLFSQREKQSPCSFVLECTN